MPDDAGRPEIGNPHDDGEASIEEIRDAARQHTGRILEYDPAFDELIGSPYPTPEAQIAAGAELTGVVEEVAGVATETPASAPLKTRLPGDTSSDPHTDVGDDNAIKQQKRNKNPK